MGLMYLYRSDKKQLNPMGPWATEKEVAKQFGRELGYTTLYVIVLDKAEFDDAFDASGYGFIPTREFDYKLVKKLKIE